MARGRTVRVVVLWGLLVGLLMSPLTLYGLIKSAESRRWAEMQRWCEEVAREARARDSQRPVLRGEPFPGNAWDDYNAALGCFWSTADLSATMSYMKKSPKADKEQARLSVNLYESALPLLRRGASRSHARRTFYWEGSPDPMADRYSRFADFAACKARFLAEESHPREAMELLLDTAQYGEDVALNGDVFDGLTALSILFVVFDELKALLESGTLRREDCRELARELEVLDRSFPREADAYAIDPMPGGFQILRVQGIAPLLKDLAITKPVTPTWRYGFSERLVLTGAFQEARTHSLQMKKAAGLPWKEAREILVQIEAEGGKTRNPLLQSYLMITRALSNPQPHSLFRERRAHLLLLRSLAAYRADGQVPSLEDPFGGKIFTSLDGPRLKFWSVGADGVDDGGSGDWYPRTRGKDVVLEVDR